MENQTNGLDALRAQLEGYKKSTEKKKRINREDILKKFFVPREDREIFRILPPKNSNSYWETAHFHVVQVNTPSGKRWRKIYCEAKNDPKVVKTRPDGSVVTNADGQPSMVAKACPLCEKKEAILALQDNSIRKIKKEDMTPNQLAIKAKNDEIYKEAMKWDAKTFYIFRGIDKQKMNEGVKFWRFKHNYRKQGIMDKLQPALQQFIDEHQTDFTDPVNGADLTIYVVDNSIGGNENRTFRDVSSIQTKRAKLSEDSMISNEWLNDDIHWRDVFKPAKAKELDTVGYLERIAKGTDPYWDDSDPNNKRWVFPDPADHALQEAANTRKDDDDEGDSYDEDSTPSQVSNVVNQSYNNVTPQNVTQEDVGTFQNPPSDAMSMEPQQQPAQQSQPQVASSGGEIDLDDLPF
jgi:hypothetical protein